MRLAFEVSASCQRTVPVSSRKFAFRPKEVHDREDAIANTRDACAPQMRDHRSQLQPLTDYFSLITGTLASRPRRWRWARPWRRLKPRGRRRSGRGCRCRRRRAAAGREHPHVIDIFFVLPTTRVKVESGGIRDIPSGIVRHNGDVIAYLVLVRITFERIKRIAHCDVGCPRRAGVSAKGIEKL